ncbi:P-loop containing nucleoside triphosphate hydrolase protein [Rhodotorula toruloides]|uniref:P-loop containing nucleoside triphosphate hydrolase protein n=1 Tax=Rhodotorula toruloides TaxID=5286 RepID=A0A2T0A2U6_RHOTO|nr:P-loop containing nucleoside triphosphate hydrolase protein [Rhodotorula toruloides]
MSTPQEARLVRRLSHISHILLVLSGKGGVGKSSVSVQLALSLLASDPSLRIGLLDVDLTGPSLPRMLGMEGRDVLASEDGWVPVARTLSSPGLLACISIGFLLRSSRESVVWRGPKKDAMVRQFLGEVVWGELDWLVVDTPPGTSDEHISLLESLRPLLAPQQPNALPLPTLSSVLVSTPQALSLLDVSKELSFVRRTQLPLLGLIENMSGYVCPHCGDVVGVFGQGGGEDFCRREEEKCERGEVEQGVRFLGRVPIDRELVGLLDDVAAHGAPTVDAEDASRGDAGGGEGRKSLVERYQAIPSFPVVRAIADTVRSLVDEQVERERAQGKRLVAVERASSRP